MHLYKLSSGRWRVAVRHNGQRASGTAETKAKANVLGAQLLLELGAKRTPHAMTVAELLDGHLATVAWSPTTVVDAQRVVDRLPEPFRTRPVGDVDGAVLAGLYQQLGRAGWSAHRVRRLHMTLSTAYATAVTWGWVNANPCRHVTPPRTEPRDVVAPSTEDVAAVLRECEGTFALFVRLAATVGARRGELVALRWEAVDLDTGALLIARALVAPKGGITERDTKTKRRGHRTLALDAATTAMLRRHRVAQTELAIASGFPRPVWVFSHNAGVDPWRPDYTSRLFRQACRRAGVSVRLHDLRHYVATMKLGDGESLWDVAEQLGHASVKTTGDVYGHYLPGRGRESVERRAGLLPG